MSGCAWGEGASIAWRFGLYTTLARVKFSTPLIKPARPDGHPLRDLRSPPTSLPAYWPATQLASYCAHIARSLFFYVDNLQLLATVEQFGWQIRAFFTQTIEQQCTRSDNHV